MRYFNNLSCQTTQKKKICRQTKEERLSFKCKFGLILKLQFFFFFKSSTPRNDSMCISAHLFVNAESGFKAQVVQYQTKNELKLIIFLMVNPMACKNLLNKTPRYISWQLFFAMASPWQDVLRRYHTYLKGQREPAAYLGSKPSSSGLLKGSDGAVNKRISLQL